MTHHFAFEYSKKRLTQENSFRFCKKYGLFNSFIFLTIKKFLLSYFPNFHGQRSGGGWVIRCHSRQYSAVLYFINGTYIFEYNTVIFLKWYLRFFKTVP